MDIEVIDSGRNNRVEVAQSVRDAGQLTIIFNGDNNLVQVGDGVAFMAARMQLGSHNTVVAAPGSRLTRLDIYAASHATIRIGANVNCTFDTSLFAHEPGTISIGDGCLIAGGCLVSCSDMHSIIDATTGERLNPAQDIVIEDRVWLGDQVRVMKGVTIGAGSIVGAGAIVTRSIPASSLAAGTPARVVRTNVTWRPDLI